MDKKERKHVRSKRVSMALSNREWNLMRKAARIVGDAPTAFMRDSAKRVARQVLARAGVKIRLDRPILGQEATVEGQEAETGS